MRRRAILRLSPEILFSLLELPNTILLDAEVDQFGAGSLDIVIEGPSMPECQEGDYPLVIPFEEVNHAI